MGQVIRLETPAAAYPAGVDLGTLLSCEPTSAKHLARSWQTYYVAVSPTRPPRCCSESATRPCERR